VAILIVVPFTLMGQVLGRTGGAAYFADIAMSGMGHFRGGAAKIAVVGSALFGPSLSERIVTKRWDHRFSAACPSRVRLQTRPASTRGTRCVRWRGQLEEFVLSTPNWKKIAGDALETATVKRALSGVDVVIQSLGVSPGPEVIFRPTRFFSKTTRLLVTVMEQAHVNRLICVTGFGAGDSRGHGGFLYTLGFHLLLGRVYDDKDVQESIVRRSKLDWEMRRESLSFLRRLRF
jgi:NAD(P)H-binding/Tripartite ATP-independent periplasmic transporter, DctM component